MLEWGQGRAEINAMLANGLLGKITPNRTYAESLLKQADTHLQSATRLLEPDIEAAFSLTYDAARKALVAHLVNQGLRPTTTGQHIATYDAVRAQLVPPMDAVLRPFERMRRRRRDSQYPDAEIETFDPDEVRETIPQAQEIINRVRRLLDEMPVY